MNLMDTELEKLKGAVADVGGENHQLWQAVELHEGVVYNQYRNMRSDYDSYQYYCFTKSSTNPQYMTKTYDRWQDAARDFLAWATFGVRNNGTNKG